LLLILLLFIRDTAMGLLSGKCLGRIGLPGLVWFWRSGWEGKAKFSRSAWPVSLCWRLSA